MICLTVIAWLQWLTTFEFVCFNFVHSKSCLNMKSAHKVLKKVCINDNIYKIPASH